MRRTLPCVLLACAHWAWPAAASGASGDVPPPHRGRFPFGTLHNGRAVPLVGLGCASGVRGRNVATALDAGYRLLDTAQAYKWGYREDEVGDAVRDSPVSRDDIFLQTKIHPEDLGYDATARAAELSFDRLHVPVVDSVLIHKPRCWEGACSRKPEGTWEESWRALEDLYTAGRIGALGICDVDDKLLDALLRQRIKPHVVQNFMDPFRQDRAVRRRCQENGILYQAYSTLGTQWVHHRGHALNPVLNSPTLLAIARGHGATVAQVVINWATRHGVSVLPASTRPSRQASNLNSFVFDLSEEEVRAIDALDGMAPAPPGQTSDNLVVTFSNGGSVALESFWRSDQKGEVHLGTIQPGTTATHRTFHGHTFVFRRGGALVTERTLSKERGPTQRIVVNGDEITEL